MDIKVAKKIAEKYKKIYGRKIKGEFHGISPPNIFVSQKYHLGVLASDNYVIDDPIYWSLREEDPYRILEDRMKLINFYKEVRIDFPRKDSKIFELIFEGASSLKSVDYDIKIKGLKFIGRIRKLPFGSASARLKHIKLESTPKIPRVVLDLYESYDIKSEEAVWILYKKGFSDYYIQRLLSLGAFGLKTNRKLVPSRWAITAVHSILVKRIERKIKEYKSIDNIFLFSGGHYGNYFYVIMFPGKLDFEYFEVFLPGSVYNKEKYPIYGRDEESGGYYASKLSAYEILRSIKKKGSILCLRFVTEEYKIPLGVWVVREGVKKVINDIRKFYEFKDLLNYLIKDSEKKYKFNILNIIRKSKIIKEYRNRKLYEYFNLNIKSFK